jgi:hypothetical protein
MNGKCTHPKHKQISSDYGFSCSVAVHPFTEENRGAHGGITYIEECRNCGAQRSVNQNQWHFEFSPHGPSRTDRQAAATKEKLAQYLAIQAQSRGRYCK